MSDLESNGLLYLAPVRTRSDFLEFVRLPRMIYAKLPGFSPPLDFERKQFLHMHRAPFFRHGQARYWLARRGGKTLGRISAQIDPLAIESWGAPIGCFGALDAVDDGKIVAALLSAAAGWLTEQGMTRMRGPFTLSMSGEVGVQITGQESGSMILMPWHPTYLHRHIEASPLAKIKDVVSYTLVFDDAFSRRFRKQRARSDRHGDLRIRQLDMSNLAHDTEIIRNLYNDAWRDNWGHVPIAPHETAALAKSLRSVISADNGVIIEIDGEPAGMALMVPNALEHVDDLSGRLLPLNWLKLAWRLLRRRYQRGRVILFGVGRKFRDARAHANIAALLIGALLGRSWQSRLKAVEMGWVLEDNLAIRRAIEKNGGTLSARFRIYERDLENKPGIPTIYS